MLVKDNTILQYFKQICLPTNLLLTDILMVSSLNLIDDSVACLRAMMQGTPGLYFGMHKK